MTPIDREALVRRHNPEFTAWDPKSPLSVGNGDFAFTADFTGLQTCAGDGPGSVPRCTMSQRGFHSYPDAPKDSSALRLKEYARGSGTVGYMTDSRGQEALFDSIRVNPHRFHLGKVGLFIARAPDSQDDPSGPAAGEMLGSRIGETRQRLDLWTGELASWFTLDGQVVRVTTLCHPSLPLLAVRIESPLLKDGKIGLDLRFPYGSHEMGGADWGKEQAHESSLSESGGGSFRILRTMDELSYTVGLALSADTVGLANATDDSTHGPSGGGGTPDTHGTHDPSGARAGVRVTLAGPHRFVFTAEADMLECMLFFSRSETLPANIPGFTATKEASARHWEAFWTEGAAVSFEGSSDPRAFELERRVVLSRYLLAIQSLGELPPAETGLTCNSWYGKFHLEMHPWHALHGLLWGNANLVERSLTWYTEILPLARKRARSQGYRGARWPKMTDPSGNDSPSPIGCLLCWQQPHPILFAELFYRLKPSAETLAAHAERVFETAEFMADYPLFNADKNRYELAPPLIPAQENHEPEETLNPTFELEYWRWGLKTAIHWKERLAESVPPNWEAVLQNLSPCPLDPADPNRYAAHERCTDTYGRFAEDHPAMILALGFLPAQTADAKKMSATCDAVLAHWKRETLWGWDFPALAMTLARLGRKSDAVDALLMESPKNTWLANGHNRQEGHAALPLYLPGNGALLLAVAMMAAGWDGRDGLAPGFPDDGSWTVKTEGLVSSI